MKPKYSRRAGYKSSSHLTRILPSPARRLAAALLLALLIPVLAPIHALAEEQKKETSLEAKVDEGPTYIKANSLSLKSEDRLFVYTGGVEVTRGDLRLTSETLEGRYDQNNKIETLTAIKNVTITKGETIRATSQKALYESKTETLILTENPELRQAESVLTADLITLFLNEDRSAAEGNVRVKLVKQEEDDKKGQIKKPKSKNRR